MRLRRVDIFSRVSRSPDAADGRAAGGAGAGALGAWPFARCSTTSGLLTTPPRPVPGTSATETPPSEAARRAAGDDFTSPADAGGGAAGGGAAGGEAAGGGAAGAGAATSGGGAVGDAAGAAPASAGAAVAPAAVSSSSARSWSTLTTSP